MGGLVLDIAVAFLVKSFIRTFWFMKSFRWDRITGSVLDSTLLDPNMGCPSVRMHYRILSSEGPREGRDEVPFFLRRSARDYARTFSGNPVVTIRVNPHATRATLFFDLDQRGG